MIDQTNYTFIIFENPFENVMTLTFSEVDLGLLQHPRWSALR